MTNLYSVSYNTNNTTGGTTPPTQSATSDSTSYTFRAPTAEEYGLARTGYIFMGWAESPNAPVQEYDAGTTIELSSTSPQKTLYAIWGTTYTVRFSVDDALFGNVPSNETITLAGLPYTYTPKAEAVNIYKVGYTANGWTSVTFTEDNKTPTATPTWRAVAGGITTMQGMSSDVCNNHMKQNDPTLLVDTRKDKDGKTRTYWIEKLKDNKCWMTQNLDLDIPAEGLKEENTDLLQDWNSTSKYKPVATVDSVYSGAGNDFVASYNPGMKYCNSSNCDATTSRNNGHDSQGNYYTWTAATAGTGGGKTSGTASGSVCPKNWKLPEGTDANNAPGNFKTLITAYGITNISGALKQPLYFIGSGRVDGNTVNNIGKGWLWSSTVKSSSDAYCLSLDSSKAAPADPNLRYIGFSVRCVAR